MGDAPETDVEWARVEVGGQVLVHFNGTVHRLKNAIGSRKTVVKTFKKFASEVPISLEVLAEIATECVDKNKQGWGVPEYATEFTSGFRAKHPIKGYECNLDDIIMELNDNAGWTREQIADWIDTLPEQPVFTMKSDIITEEELQS